MPASVGLTVGSMRSPPHGVAGRACGAERAVHRHRVLTVARPDEPVRLVLQICSMMIGYLLARVPQHYDGLRAWRATRNPQSWQAAAREATVESFVHIRTRTMQPRAIPSMPLIMREVTAILPGTSI
jgi:hypothetical protein